MVTPLNCHEFNSWNFAMRMCGKGTIVNYLLTYKLPEDYVITPTMENQMVAPNAKNRYIRSVLVKGVDNPLAVTPTDEQQVFTNGPYSTVTVEAQS